jgi:hypothetical protein
LLINGHSLPDGAKAGAARALEVIIKGVEASVRKAESLRMEVIFTPRGNIQVSDLSLSNVTSSEGLASAKDGDFAAAIRRGETTVARILGRPDMLTGERFAERVGMTRMAIHKRFKKNELLGLEGAKRGRRYPAWQLGNDGRPVPGLSELLRKFAGKPWAAYRFLLQRHAGLGKLTAIDALKAGKRKPVLEAADTFVSSDFS